MPASQQPIYDFCCQLPAAGSSRRYIGARVTVEHLEQNAGRQSHFCTGCPCCARSATTKKRLADHKPLMFCSGSEAKKAELQLTVVSNCCNCGSLWRLAAARRSVCVSCSAQFVIEIKLSNSCVSSSQKSNLLPCWNPVIAALSTCK